jgi:tetratricopeptide (TPR) repeat protein
MGCSSMADSSSPLPESQRPVSELQQAIKQYDVALKQLVKLAPPLQNDPLPELTNTSNSPPDALPSLPAPAPSNSSPPAAPILAVLTARDRVQAALDTWTTSTAVASIPTESLDKLIELDTELREQAGVIEPLTQDEEWCSSFHPNPLPWWWSLKAPQNRSKDNLDWFCGVVSVTSLTVSLGLLGDIAPRFLTGGPDSFGAIAVSTQSVLTLLVAGGALTQAGQTALKQLLKALKRPEKYWPQFGAAGSVLLMFGFIILRQSLPQIATTFYTKPGIESRRNGNWSTAEDQFKRAIKLNADDAEAHFQLANLYEDLQLPDQARPEYQLAIQGGIPAATNNLARLNILKKDYPAAIALLFKALDDEKKQPLDATTKHAVLKNFAWARLKQGNYPDAAARLQEAIGLESTALFTPDELADTHCLLAQVMEAQGEKKKALNEWKSCNSNANPTIPEQDEWSTIAQKRLVPQESSK